MLLILQTTAAVYNYGETSEAILFQYDNSILSGFGNITDKDFILGGLFSVYDCSGLRQHDLELLEAMLLAIDISRLMVVSREAKKKQHARASSSLCDHYSELFTRMAALKF